MKLPTRIDWSGCDHRDYSGNTVLIVFLTLINIVLTITIELNVHKINFSSTPPARPSPIIEPSTTDVHISHKLFPKVDRNPTAICRANRFVRASLFIVPICIVFAYRIQNAQKGYYIADDCRGKVAIEPLNWAVVTIFNILPLASACFAWLRSLADCILVRFDKSVSYNYWPPAFPIFMPVFLINFVALNGTHAAMWMMGQEVPSQSADGTSGGVEMGRGLGSGEDQGLMHSMDGLVEGEDEDDDVTVFSRKSSFGSKTSL
jgi:hypothetical protein